MAAQALRASCAGLLLVAVGAGSTSMSSFLNPAEISSVEKQAESSYEAMGAEEKAAEDAAKAYCEAHKLDPEGTTCCMKSTCYWDDSYPYQQYALQIPNVPCDKSRGDTKCEGGSLFPLPKAGICVCKQGHCINGACSNKTAGALGDMENMLSNLFDARPAVGNNGLTLPVRQWHGVPATVWCVCITLWMCLGFAVGAAVAQVRRLRAALPRWMRSTKVPLQAESGGAE